MILEAVGFSSLSRIFCVPVLFEFKDFLRDEARVVMPGDLSIRSGRLLLDRLQAILVLGEIATICIEMFFFRVYKVQDPGPQDARSFLPPVP